MVRGLSLGHALCALAFACMLAGLPPLFAFSASGAELSEGHSAVLYDNRHGLPTSEANAIVETDEGFIWIGSYSGLIRYDGRRFERMDSSFGIGSVISLYVDSRKRLWAGTNDGGAAVRENGRFRIYNKDDGLKSLSVRSIVEAGDGSIYLGTTEGVAWVGADMRLRLIEDPEIRESFVDCLCAGRDGGIYGLTKGGELFTLDDGRLTGFYSSQDLGIPDVRVVLADGDKDGLLYLGTSGSKIYCGTLGSGTSPLFHTLETFDCSPVSYINALRWDGGAVWVCADTGIGFLKDGRFVLLPNLPLSTAVEDMMVDYQGNLWFVSSQQGAMKLVPNQFVDVFEQYRLESTVVTTTCLYDGKLFVGTKNDGLIVLQDGFVLDHIPVADIRFADGGNRTAALPAVDNLLDLLSNSRIRSIVRDSRNRLWISTFGDTALLCYDGGNVICFSSANGLPSNRVRAVCELNDGSIAASCTGGLALIRDGEVVRVYGEEDGISNSELLTAAQMPDGAIVVGTDGGGLYVLRPDGVGHIGTEEGLGSEIVMRIKRGLPHATRNVLWIVTGNSLAYMDGDYKVHTLQNFPYSNNFDLYETAGADGGELWVLSSNGIHVVSVEQLLAGGKIAPLYYGLDNGLPCIATSNSYSGLSEEGDLYIAGMTGVAQVNLGRSFGAVSDFKMAVPFVEADGKRLYPEDDGSFFLPSSVRKLTVYSYVFNYSLMDPQLTYRLSGLESEAVPVKRSELMPVIYTNLGGGEYHFVLQLLDAQGVAGKTLDVPIIKRKAFLELLWVQIAAGILFFALLSAAVKLYIFWRTRRFLRKEKNLRQLTREIVEAFARVIDMKDRYTNGHSTRVAEYTQMLARELGYDEDTVEKYYNIALLHDIGKIGIPSEILNKPGKLTEAEFNTIKSHSALGYEALKDISIMPELAVGAGAHHERPDGMGYPKGLGGEEIPRVAQIISVADTFDAMYSDRPYRKRMNFETAVSIMKEVSGTQLAPDVVGAFMRLVARGEFRAPDDYGGGTTEDINNIRKKFVNGGTR